MTANFPPLRARSAGSLPLAMHVVAGPGEVSPARLPSLCARPEAARPNAALQHAQGRDPSEGILQRGFANSVSLAPSRRSSNRRPNAPIRQPTPSTTV